MQFSIPLKGYTVLYRPGLPVPVLKESLKILLLTHTKDSIILGAVCRDVYPKLIARFNS